MIRITKSSLMRWAGHVARMGRRFRWEIKMEKGHYEDLDVGAWIITGT
jgi:hypothetical protein